MAPADDELDQPHRHITFFAVGRLKPDVSLEQGQADLTVVAAALEQQYPDSNKGRGVTATRLQDELVGDVRLTLYLLWGVVGVVLLIACANTATLLLGQSDGAHARGGGSRGARREPPPHHPAIDHRECAAGAASPVRCGLALAYWGTTGADRA